MACIFESLSSLISAGMTTIQTCNPRNQRGAACGVCYRGAPMETQSQLGSRRHSLSKLRISWQRHFRLARSWWKSPSTSTLAAKVSGGLRWSGCGVSATTTPTGRGHGAARDVGVDRQLLGKPLDVEQTFVHTPMPQHEERRMAAQWARFKEECRRTRVCRHRRRTWTVEIVGT